MKSIIKTWKMHHTTQIRLPSQTAAGQAGNWFGMSQKPTMTLRGLQSSVLDGSRCSQINNKPVSTQS
ncbi:hypothetical protein FKM82_021676 [Ascaphus truei]